MSCGSLNEWLALAPQAQAACGLVGALVSVNDFAGRPAKVLEHDEVLGTGTHRFRFRATPQVPHAWDAGLMFEETNGTLFCSDLFHQLGEVEAIAEADIVDRFRAALIEYDSGPFANYLPYTTADRADSRRSRRPKTENAPAHAWLGLYWRWCEGDPGHGGNAARNHRLTPLGAVLKVGH